MTAVDFTRRWREHRRMVRNTRAMARAIDEAGTPAMRSELVALAGLQASNYTR